MQLQRLTEELLLTVISLNRSCIPQSVQEHLKGENFLLSYLDEHGGCSTPGRAAGGSGRERAAHGGHAARAGGKWVLRRCADSYDRRRVVVHLTELGRQTAEQMHTTLCAHVQRVLEQLGEQDSRELIRLLGRITEIEASA